MMLAITTSACQALPIMTLGYKVLEDLATLEILEQATLEMEIARTPFSVATNFAWLQKSFATRLNVCTSKLYLVGFEREMKIICNFKMQVRARFDAKTRHGGSQLRVRS